MHDDQPRWELPGVTQALHRLFNRLDRPRPDGRRLDAFVEEAFDELKGDLGFRSVAVYAEQRGLYDLRRSLGESLGFAPAFDASCASLASVLRHRVYLFADPGTHGSPWRDRVTPCLPSAGVVVGRRPHRHILYFLLDAAWRRERVDFALNVLRAGLDLELLEERVSLSFRQAAEIQESLVREAPPPFAAFDIASRSLPAEEIGGDFCDFVHVDNDLLGFAIGDASGHGLPAALLVRDVVTGLRMGFEKHLRMEYVFGKLNRVIHRGNPSSRFISLFYGELDSNGNLTYVNAGHQPPLLVRRDRLVELKMGGTIVGPFPEVSFRRGFVRLDPGNLLVLFTDGLVERRGAGGEFFGEGRVRALVHSLAEESAGQIAERLLETALTHGGGRPWEDDVTILVIKRLVR